MTMYKFFSFSHYVFWSLFRDESRMQDCRIKVTLLWHFIAHLSTTCGGPINVVRRLSCIVNIYRVDTLEATFFAQSTSEWAIVVTHRPSASVVCPSVYIFLFTLAFTNIYQSAPNLVKLYMTIRSQISLIMDLIGPEHLELFALNLKKLLYFTLFTL